MRRTPGASAFRLRGRVCAVPLIIGMLLATPGLAVAQPGSPDLAALVAAVANANQKLARPRRRHPGPAGKRQQGDRRRADRAGQRRRRAAGSRCQRAAGRGGQHRDRRGAAAVRHLRRRNVCQRPVGFLPDRQRPRRHPSHRGRRSDVVGELAAGDHRSSARPHRASEQGIGRAAGQAERRQGRRRRGSQSADRGVGADAGAADVQARSRPSWTS